MSNEKSPVLEQQEQEPLTADMFVVVGKNEAAMDAISRPNLSFWQDAWRRLKKNRPAFIGLCIVALYGLLAIFAPMLSHYSYTAMDPNAMYALPSLEHWLGCDATGRDLWVRV